MLFPPFPDTARVWVYQANRLLTATEATTAVAFLSPVAECSTPAVDNVRVMPAESAVQAHPIDGPARREASLRGNSLRR